MLPCWTDRTCGMEGVNAGCGAMGECYIPDVVWLGWFVSVRDNNFRKRNRGIGKTETGVSYIFK